MKYISLIASLMLASATSALSAEVPGPRVLKHGRFFVDHIGIGVSDTRAGLRWLEERTGAKTFLVEAEPGQWYQSGGLQIGDGIFVEIAGPNPKHKGFHPLKQMMKELKEPWLFFYYISVADFKEFDTFAAREGILLERVESVEYEKQGQKVAYTRAVVGPGFSSERPNVIEWKSRARRSYPEQQCHISNFEIRSATPEALAALFKKLKVDIPIVRGDSRLRLTMDCPKGEVKIAGDGLQFSGISGFLRTIGLYLRYLFDF